MKIDAVSAVALCVLAACSESQDLGSEARLADAGTGSPVEAGVDASSADGGADVRAPDGGSDATTVDGAPDAPGSDATAGPATALVGGQNRPSHIAVDATHVYWTNQGDSGQANGSVMKVPIGGGAVTTLASQLEEAWGIAIDQGSVYFTSSSGSTAGIYKIAKSGGAATLLRPASTPRGIATDGTHVFVAMNSTGAEGVLQIPLGGGPTIDLVPGRYGTWEVALDATSVYVDQGGGLLASVPIGGGAAKTIAGLLDGVGGLAANATHVYFVDDAPGPSGRILRCPVAGCANPYSPEVIASGQVGPTGIALDAMHVYWTSYSDGTVRRAPLGGGTPTTVATGQMRPFRVTLDATNAYWTDNASGEIWRAPK